MTTAASALPRLAIVVPCHNEEEVLPETVRTLDAVLAALIADNLVSRSSELWFVDDGSRDRSWQRIASLTATAPHVRGLRLSRNFGHQAALLAGLKTADADITVTIDADLQDDPTAIRQMVENFHAGFDVVCGVRRRRDSDTFFKRITARAFYRLMTLLGAEIIEDHADFRLLSRRAVAALGDFGERNLFLRGIVPLLGFPLAVVSYDRSDRSAGASKYPAARMLSFAWSGITSFSVVPLQCITLTGFALVLGCIIASGWALYIRFFTLQSVPGWASQALPIYFIGGFQILSLGVIGEYLGKVYTETKRRPRFQIQELL